MRQSFVLLIFLMILTGCNFGGGGGGGSSGGGIISPNTIPNTTNTFNGAYVSSITSVATTINSTKDFFDFNLNFNKNVSVNNCIPTIWVKIGTNLHLSMYTSGSGTKVHKYRVNFPSGALDTNGPEVLSPITAAGTCLTETNVTNGDGVRLTFQPKTLSNIVINQIGPKLTNVELTPSGGDILVGQTISIKATFEKLLNVISSSELPFTINTFPRNANYVSGTGTNIITYSYVLTSSDIGLAELKYSTAPTDSADASFNSPMNPDVPKIFNFNILPVHTAPVANDITPPSFDKNTVSTITLSYTDAEGDLATSCSVDNLTKISIINPCSCVAGECKVDVKGDLYYAGLASFTYTVNAGGMDSNTANASLTINNTSSTPVANNISPSAFNEDTQSIITLEYTDSDNDQATACTLSDLTNVTVTQNCACSSGSCTVGVTGTLNYNGAASFNYTVTANGDTSNSATGTLTINPVDDAPVAANITPAAFDENTQSIITLSYSDVENHQGATCTISGETNVSVTQACACSSGECTVGVTGTLDYSGSASFNYTVTANGLTSNSATASLTINNVPTAPIANNITPAAFDEDTSSLITLDYSDPNGDLATSCTISGETKVSAGACTCSGSTCSVTVTGLLNQNGSASFNYTVTANGENSNSATATFTINPIDDAPVAANITPAAFDEDSQSIITLSYSDIENHEGATCTISGETNVTVTQACACSSGECTVGVTGLMNYSGSASFNYTVTANTLTSNSATASLTINPLIDIPTIANSSISGEEGPFVADGVATSTITITLKDAQNYPVEGTVPQFSATNTSGQNTYGTCSSTNASGVSTCTLKSTKAEIKTLNLTDPISKQGNNVTFIPGAVSELNSTITGTTSIVANGVAESQITITLKDAFNNTIQGENPTFTATNTGSTNVYSTCSTTGATGVSTCTLKSTKAELKTLQLTTPINKIGSQVEFIAGPVVPEYSTIEGTTPVTADGVSPSFITITLKDAFQNPVSGVSPIFNATDTGSLNSYGLCSNTNSSGIASCTLASTKAEVKTLQLTSPVAVTGMQTITFITVGPVIANSEITGTTNVLADGQSISSVTIVLRDINHDGIAGLTPTFDATNTNNGNTYGTCSMTDLGGYSTCTLKSTVAEEKTLRITNPILKSDGNVTFIAGPAVSGNSTITGTTNIVADGIQTSTITINLLDANNNPYSDSIPTFSATNTGSTNVYAPCTLTSTPGQFTCTMTSTKAEAKVLKIETPVLKSGDTVLFKAGSPSTLTSSITGTTNIIANGVDTSEVTIILKDANGNTIENETPEYLVVGDGVIQGVCDPTSAAGQSKCFFSSTVAGSKTLSLTQPISLNASAPVVFIQNQANSSNSSISVQPGPFEANGVTSASVTITLKDSNNIPIVGIVPQFIVDNQLGVGYGAGCSQTNSNGIATCPLTSTKVGLKTVSLSWPIEMPGNGITDVVSFVAGPASIANSTITHCLSSSANTTFETNSNCSVFITLMDANNNPVTSGTAPSLYQDSSTPYPLFKVTLTDGTVASGISLIQSCQYQGVGLYECIIQSSSTGVRSLILELGSDVNLTKAATKDIEFAAPLVVKGVNLEVPIEMIDYPLEAYTVDYRFERTATRFDKNNYSSADSQEYFFEVVGAYWGAVGTNGTVKLVYNTGSADVDAVTAIIPGGSTNTSIKTYRKRFPFNPVSTPQTYWVKVPGNSTMFYIYSARIIVVQKNAIKTRLYFPMINSLHSSASDLNSNTPNVFNTSQSTTWTLSDTFFSGWLREDNKYDPVIANGTPWALEAVLKTNSSSSPCQAALVKTSNGSSFTNTDVVTESIVKTVGTSIQVSYNNIGFSGSASNFTDGSIYRVAIKGTKSTNTCYIYKAGLWLELNNPEKITKARVYYRIGSANSTTVHNQNIDINKYRFKWDLSSWSNPIVYLRSYGKATVSGTELRDSGATDFSTLASNVVTSSAAVANSATPYSATLNIATSSSAMNLTNGNEYIFRHTTGIISSAPAFTVSSFVLIDVTPPP